MSGPPPPAAWDTYERWCAAEQVASDRRAGRRSVGSRCEPAGEEIAAAVEAARAMLRGRSPAAAPVPVKPPGDGPAATLAAVEGGLPLWPVVADCRLAVPVDWTAFVAWTRAGVRRLLDGPMGAGLSRVTVFGIRSGGSYLGPLVCAVMAEAGVAVEYRSVRPVRTSWCGLHRVTRPEDYQSVEIGSLDDADACVVVDDLLGGGGTVAALRERLRSCGPARPTVLVCLCEQGAPEVRRIAATAGFDLALVAEPGTVTPDWGWHETRVLAMADGCQLVQVPVSRAPLGDARPRFPVVLDGPHDRRVVRFAGSGPVARQQLHADRVTSATGLAAAGEYGIEPWLAGRRLRFAAPVPGHHLGPLVDQAVAAASRATPVAAGDAELAELRAALLAVLAEHGSVDLPDAGSAWWGRETTRYRVASLPANGNHRHLVAGPDRAVRRTSALRLHGDRVGDPHEELAAIICELWLRGDTLARVFADYHRRAGEPVDRSRLLYAMLRHAVREVNEVEYLSLVVRESPGQDPARTRALASAVRRRLAGLRPAADRAVAVLGRTPVVAVA